MRATIPAAPSTYYIAITWHGGHALKLFSSATAEKKRVRPPPGLVRPKSIGLPANALQACMHVCIDFKLECGSKETTFKPSLILTFFPTMNLY